MVNLNKFMIRKNMKSYYKLFIITPFAYIPYYIFCGINDKLSISTIKNKCINDFIYVLPSRIAGDYIRFVKLP